MSLERAGKLLALAERVSLFTGAGISTESGIPDFRSPGGIWETYQPVYYQEFVASEQARVSYWAYKLETWRAFRGAAPNAAHRAIVEFHEQGRLVGVITQNIDGLQQAAGLPEERVIELHGSNARVGCIDCNCEVGWEASAAQMQAGAPFPLCPECGGGLVKPRTVSFGQSLSHDDLARSEQWAVSCDLLLVIGASLQVSPANMYPMVARSGGARLIILNRDETPQDDTADAVVRGEAAQVLPELLGVR